MSSSETNKIVPLNIKELLAGDAEYVIPIYQRNYSWKAKEIEQLVQDIIDYSKYNSDKNYYIGTLVVANRREAQLKFDTIDGQQRLTTLFILTAALKQEKTEELDWFNDINLSFESRKISDKTLKAVFGNKFQDENYEVNIRAAFDICRNEIKKKTAEHGISINTFANYLYKYVKILRVTLPDTIDLNHYFEIMNSRGEQLEKHEVLKAKLMASFKHSERQGVYSFCFNLIWEACQNMERYVQYGFTPEQRNVIFGAEDWNNLLVNSFDEFVNKIISINSEHTDYRGKQEIALTIDDLIKPVELIQARSGEEYYPDRFNSVITFPNFLLHVLRIQTDNEAVALDDKQLISSFERLLKNRSAGEKINFSKEFIFNLLKCKFLFDKYIIKRETTTNTDRWVLQRLIRYSSNTSRNAVKYLNTFGLDEDMLSDNDNRRILMLLSMFHVSIPSQSYKYWLYAALRYVYHQEEVKSSDYIKYLEHIAKSFVFDRFLSENPLEYTDMIVSNLEPIKRDAGRINKYKLMYYGIENNLVFNFTDYLLWIENKENDSKIKSYEYSFRSSVEHYYPQNPINKDIDIIKDQNILHSFGNLCLISHEKNSRLNNYSPKAKKEHYSKSDAIDSVKQFIMMNDKWGEWNATAIEQHEKDMMDLFARNLNSDFKWKKIALSKAQIWYKRYKNENKQLLIRALMCFGPVDVENGWTSGMEKWNFYQWDKIEQSEAFQLFENYVQEKDPSSLEEIIEDNLRNNEDLKKDSYRFAFVSRPYIIDYCEEGNYGWGEDGKKFLLLRTRVASKYNACDLYCFCIRQELLRRHDRNIITSYIDSGSIEVSLTENEDSFIPVPFDWSCAALFNIWNDNNGHICYEIDTKGYHGNSRAIRKLKEKGWIYSNNKKLFHSSKEFLVTLTDDVEENIVKTIKEFNRILKLLE